MTTLAQAAALLLYAALVLLVGRVVLLTRIPQPATLPHMKCDGLWMGDDGTRCLSLVATTCACSRCDRESDDEKFHACADPAHRRVAGQRHERVRGRPVAWAQRGSS